MRVCKYECAVNLKTIIQSKISKRIYIVCKHATYKNDLNVVHNIDIKGTRAMWCENIIKIIETKRMVNAKRYPACNFHNVLIIISI